MVERCLHPPPLLVRPWVIMHGRSIAKQESPSLFHVHLAPSVEIRRSGDGALDLIHHLLSLCLESGAAHHKVKRILDFPSRAALAYALRPRYERSRMSPRLNLKLTGATPQFRFHTSSVAHPPRSSLLQIPRHIARRHVQLCILVELRLVCFGARKFFEIVCFDCLSALFIPSTFAHLAGRLFYLVSLQNGLHGHRYPVLFRSSFTVRITFYTVIHYENKQLLPK